MRRSSTFEKKDTAKGSGSGQEDKKLVSQMQKPGESSSESLPQAAGLHRYGKWFCRGQFGEDEEDLIIRLHGLLGDRWSLIAGRLPGRSESEVKSYWDSHIRDKLTTTARGKPNEHHHLNKISSTEMHAGKAVGTNVQIQATSDSTVNSIAMDINKGPDPEITMPSTAVPVPALNLDLTLSTPQIYPRDKVEDGRH